MPITDKLESLGLSEKEAKIYLALLELSQADVNTIAKKAGIKRPITYVALNSLVEKGLSSTFEKDKRAFYVAENPENLQTLFNTKKREMEEQQGQLNTVMSDLKTIYSLQGEERPFVRFFEGKAGLLATRNEMFEKENDTIRMLYPMEGFNKLYTDSERSEGHSRRNKKSIHARVLYTFRNGDIPEDKSRTSLRVQSDKLPLAADVSLYDGKVRIASLNEKLSGIIIDDPEIYKTFVSIFELAWLGSESLKNKAH